MKSPNLDFSEYEITNENHAEIPENENVEMFFKQRITSELNQSVILIKLKQVKQSALNRFQEESSKKINKSIYHEKKKGVKIKNNKKNPEKRDYGLNFKRKKNEEIPYAEEFFKKFPGLKVFNIHFY